MTILTAMLLQSATTSAVAPDDANTVVVTATREALRDALDRCKKGGCSARQDAVASIRYAEVQFRGGRYLDARRTLQAAVHRVAKAAAAEPVAVAALYEATVTVALNEGDQDVARHASGGRLKTLRDAFGDKDPRYLAAVLGDIDIEASLGRYFQAQSRYASLERRARDAGAPDIAAIASLRRAAWDHASYDDTAARRRLTKLTANPAQSDFVKEAAAAETARYRADKGDFTALNQLAVRSTRVGPANPDVPPTLLWQPPLPDPADPASMSKLDLTGIIASDGGDTPTFVIKWADVAFDIAADGTVRDVTVTKDDQTTGWLRPVKRAVAKRRYLASSVTPTNAHRVERWSLTADYALPTRSLTRKRALRPHYTMVDLTSTAPTTIRPAHAPESSQPPSPVQ